MAGTMILYNPDQKRKAEIIEEFVLRQQEFNSIFQILKSSDFQHPPQHFMIQGQRGMGKTTLLLRLKYAVEDDPELSHWLLPLKFSEEQYHISSLVDLWESMADMLESGFDGFEGLAARLSQWERESDFEERAAMELVNALKTRKKRVLVMIDNLGDLFEKIGGQETHRLRQILLTHSEIQILGASAYVLEHHFRYDNAFYEFFQVVPLKPISKEQTNGLMRMLGKRFSREVEVEQLLQEQSAKLEVLRRFTGGVPRTMALLFGIFMDHQSGSTFETLQLLLDEVNSLYKHRMDELKPQQQKIMDTLAKAWEPVSSRQILEQSKLYRADVKSNQISAQLKSMEENQLIESIDGPGKNKSYRIRERFFNIWYLMRYGKSHHQEELKGLVRFMELRCNQETLKGRGERNFLLAEAAEAYESVQSANLEDWVKNQDWEKLMELFESITSKPAFLQKIDFLNQLILSLLKGKQYYFVFNQFKKPEFELMKYARPYWYVLMWFMRDQFPGEYEKVGSELKETADEIIQEIEKIRTINP